MLPGVALPPLKTAPRPSAVQAIDLDFEDVDGSVPDAVTLWRPLKPQRHVQPRAGVTSEPPLLAKPVGSSSTIWANSAAAGVVASPHEPPLDTSRLVLSERAAWETKMIRALDAEDITFDQDGIVDSDDHETLGELVRLRRVADVEMAEVAESVDAWRAWRNERTEIALLRTQLIEAGIQSNTVASDKISTRTKFKRGRAPPSPVMRFVRRSVNNDKPRIDGEVFMKTDERYDDMCHDLGLATSAQGHQTFQLLKMGSAALQTNLANRAYLGNRGAQAVFLALVSMSSRGPQEADQCDLQELRALDFSGQGLGNEAASALAALLPHCMKLGDLNLSRNRISETGAAKLLQVIQIHPHLVSVCLDSNPVPSWIRVRLKEILHERQVELLSRSA